MRSGHPCARLDSIPTSTRDRPTVCRLRSLSAWFTAWELDGGALHVGGRSKVLLAVDLSAPASGVGEQERHTCRALVEWDACRVGELVEMPTPAPNGPGKVRRGEPGTQRLADLPEPAVKTFAPLSGALISGFEGERDGQTTTWGAELVQGGEQRARSIGRQVGHQALARHHGRT